MPRHITVFPASTKAGRETIRQLLEHENGPIVRGIYRDPSKAPDLFTANSRFEVTKGDVTTGAGLDFSSSDVVFYIPPPTYDGTETAEFATKTARFVEKALKDAPSVKKLVLHSTLGAEFEHGTGILILNHITDKILKESVPEVIIVKPGYYFETWLPSLEDINAETPTFDSPFYPPEHKFPMLSVHDIGEYCAKALLDDSQGPRLRYAELVGPESYSTLDLQKAIQLATGKNVAMNSIPKEELSAYFSKTLLPVYVPELVDLVKALSVGGLLAEGGYAHNEHTVVGKVDINDGVRRMLSESS